MRSTSSHAMRPAGGEPVTWKPGESWESFSPVTPAEIAETPVVFAGYGITAPDRGWDDYEGIDAKGRVVMILRHGPREGRPDSPFGTGRSTLRYFSFRAKAAAARAAGAKALILVNDRIHHPDVPDAIQPSRAPGGLPFLFAGEEVAAALMKAAGRDFTAVQRAIDEEGRPRSFPLSGVTVSLALARNRVRTANVVGFLPGADAELARQYVVIGGHYDHIGTGGAGALDPQAVGEIRNGADDNASGTAGVIELAEHFATSEARPKRSMLFVAFTGEEIGLRGSRHYVRSPVRPLSDTVLMLNMDMIGRSTGNLHIGGTGTSPVFDGLITKAVAGSGLNVTRGRGGMAPSDSLLFFQAGVPVLFFFTGTHPDYHRATDTWEKLEYGNQKKILDVAAAVARGVADLPERPAFVRDTSGGFGNRSGPRLGVNVDRSFPGPGVKLAVVLQATPAARAGLVAGDVILSFGGKETKDLRALVTAIRSRKIGDEVEVVYERDGKRRTVKVKLS